MAHEVGVWTLILACILHLPRTMIYKPPPESIDLSSKKKSLNHRPCYCLAQLGDSSTAATSLATLQPQSADRRNENAFATILSKSSAAPLPSFPLVLPLRTLCMEVVL